MDFIAVDFETATNGLTARVRLGSLPLINWKWRTHSIRWSSRRVCAFSYSTTRVHGIRADDVLNAPTLDELFPGIAEYFNMRSPVVAHNALFDMSVLKKSLKRRNRRFFII
jgi:DNA polymerase-3 subunit epsilon